MDDFKRVEFFVVPFVLNLIFTLEAYLRYYVAPVKKKFFLQINNVIDIVAVVPFWLIRVLMVDHWFPSYRPLPMGVSWAWKAGPGQLDDWTDLLTHWPWTWLPWKVHW